VQNAPALTLNNDVRIPALGFGMDSQIAYEPVLTALSTGYRLVDTAAQYANESQVGAALRDSRLARDEVFVSTKVSNDDQGYDLTLAAFDASLTRLGLDYVDLYLIHWPVPGADRYVGTWRALERLLADGRTRAIGVSNFQIPHLRRLLDESGTVPAVNQIELHPAFAQQDLRAFHAEHGIATEAWSPLAQGAVSRSPVIRAIAERHGRTAAQVTLRWHLQHGIVAIPRSGDPGRIAENFAVHDFVLTSEDMDAIDSVDAGTRLGPHPDYV
jgi:diketogulonate reductase-like aldo/keto reductase